MKKKASPFFLLLFFIYPCLHAAEYTQGRLKLVLHEETGGFSLYGKTGEGRYEALFTDQGPLTSFLTLLADGRFYRVGKAGGFRQRFVREPLAFVFETSSFSVSEVFSFTKIPGSETVSVLRITIKIENHSAARTKMGAYFFLDTSLGEKPGQPHFLIDSTSVAGETAVRGKDSGRWWISKNNKVSLMGSIDEGDNIIFANWKRLSDASWQGDYTQGRSFSIPPFSIDDSAVCYWFKPVPLSRGEARTYTILLAFKEESTNSNEDSGLAWKYRGFLKNGELMDFSGLSREEALLLTQEVLVKIDDHITAGTITEKEFSAMKRLIERLKARFGFL